jgi:flagellin-like protein
MKMFRSRKALSPVVASIILIAVTVAVSIAVAAWMGALTFGFMGSSSLTITSVDFLPNGGSGLSNNYMVLHVKNTGTKQVTVAQVKINNIDYTSSINATASTVTYGPAITGTITINNLNWANGNPYKIDLYDSSGTGVGSTQQNAPGA